MTTFSPSSTQHQPPVTSNTTSTGSRDKSNKPYNFASNGFTVQRPSLGIHQNGAIKTSYYTTTRQAQNTSTDDLESTFENDRNNIGQAGVTNHNHYDEDDVEIIMHDDHYNHGDFTTCTSSGQNKDSTPAIPSPTATAPYQEQRQPNTDLKEALIDLPLQRQLEYYFSRQNLANDSYLVSQMDPDLYVPIATIAKFKRVMDLTFDMDRIVTTLRRSSVVTVDESGTKVKPNVSMQRTTVILRDVPDATEEEIHQFLQDINPLPIINIKNEYADMWYITFKCEKDALEMMSDTRGKLFKGQYVAARMKSEPVVGSIQARKSVLQAESLSSAHTTGTQGHHNRMNVYNGPNYSSNSHTPYQYPSHHPGISYSHYTSNGTHHRGGRYMNNYVNNRNHNNNRRTNMGGRGWYKNNYGGVGRSNNPMGNSSTSWVDRQSHQSSPQSQGYQQSRVTTTNNTSISSVSTKNAPDEPSTESSTTHHHRDNKGSRAGPWQHKNHSPPHQPGSNHSTHAYSSWKNNSATSSTTTSLEAKHHSTDKHSESTTETTTSAPIPASPSSSSINTANGFGKEQAISNHQKDATRNRKIKRGDKKKKNKKPSNAVIENEAKHQEQPDLQSGTFFPPLPGSKNTVSDINPTATKPKETSASSSLEKQLSIADIVKKGHELKKKQSSTVIPEGGSNKVDNQQKQQTKPTSKGNESTKIKETPQNEDLFPLLCPIQDSTLPSSSFSYADMLKKKESEAN